MTRNSSSSADGGASLRIRRIRRSELPEEPVALARFLIGKTIMREFPKSTQRLSGRIVETEAYLPNDAAAHSFIGPTPRNRSLFLRPGHAYVYFCYGMHFMLNVSANRAGIGGGVLLRAIEPIEGIERMMRRRGTRRLLDLARGPGRVAQALAVDRRFDGADLCAPGLLWLGTAARPADEIGVSLRIGITKDAHLPYRFYERGNPYVSGPRRLNP